MALGRQATVAKLTVRKRLLAACPRSRSVPRLVRCRTKNSNFAVKPFPRSRDRDSALVAGSMRVHVDTDGHILGLRSGPLELKRVEAFDLTGITDGFVTAFAPRVAAQAAAAASRVEIALPAAQLDRFVGEYTSGPATISILRDGEHLVLHLPQQQQGMQLLAMSPTEFFVRRPELVVSFETDPAGRVAGLSVGQGETKHPFIRKN